MAERFSRTLKEQAIYGRMFRTVEGVCHAVRDFMESYNSQWRVEKNALKAPKNSVRKSSGSVRQTCVQRAWCATLLAMTKVFIPQKLRPWIEARKRFKLSHAQVQMARELGMNPKNFGKLANSKQEPWKLPLREYIEECYFQRFGKEQPETVRSIEQMASDLEAKKQLRRARKEAEKNLAEGPIESTHSGD